MSGFSANHRVLLIGGEGIVLYAPSGKGIEREISLSWDVPDFDRQLVEALSWKNKSKSVIVLFDGADQAYRKEDGIPKLSPFDRPKFIRRKLELAFPSYPIRAALEIKPQKGARSVGLPTYLFIALPETETLDRVGSALFESGVPVSGFGMLPVESAGLVTEISKKLFRTAKKPSRWSVLIGQHETGGLRQVVVKDGNLALARLTPPSEAGTSGAGWVDEVVRGFKETMAYISRFGYTPADGLDVAVVCGDIEKQFFDPAAIGATNFRCLNPIEALALIGVRAFGLNKANFADALHAAWTARKRALVLPVRVPSIHRVMAPRLAARVVGGGMVLAALGIGYVTSGDYQSYLSTRDELGGKQNQVQMMQREYEQESKAFDALPMKPVVVKSVLALKEKLGENTVPPAPLLNRLKDAMGADILLQDLSLDHTPGVGLNLSGVAAPAPPGGKADRGHMRVEFTFKLPDAMQLEQKVTRSEQLQKDLEKAFPAWKVEIVSQFGKMSRTGSFQGIVGADSAPDPTRQLNDAAQFSLEGPP